MIYLYFYMTLIIAVIFHFLTRYSRRGRLLNKIPGPYPYPIIGNLLMFNSNDMHEIWNIARNLTKKYYPITKFWSITDAMVSVHHPDDLKVIFSSEKAIEKAYPYEYVRPWLKTGLLTSGGEKWRQRRRLLTPAFHFSILRKYIQIVNEEGQKLIQILKSENEESTQSPSSLLSNCTLNIICETAMGVSLDSMDSKSVSEYKNAIYNIGQVTIYRLVRPYIQTWMMPFIYKWGSLQRNALKVLHQFTTKVLNDRKAYHKSTNNKYLNEFFNENKEDSDHDIDDVYYSGKKKKLAMLDLLLAVKQNGSIDDDGIKEEVDTFVFAGHDTTQMATIYTLLLLAENKEVQDQARTEVTKFLNKNNDKIDLTDYQELQYLERCIKESLRLFPPVSTIYRYASDDLQLKNALIPAHTPMIIHFWDTHRDPNFWTEPNKFDPDRFLPENFKSQHPFAYVPFSAGSRNCIGQRFAMLEMKILLSKILYNFYLEPVTKITDIRILADIIIRPVDPIKIKFVKIKK